MELLTIAALVLAVLFASLVVALGQPTTSGVDVTGPPPDLPQAKDGLTGSEHGELQIGSAPAPGALAGV